MIDNEKLLSRLNRLSEVKTLKDVGHMTHYLFPGSHCPLLGATMAISGISDALMVVVGTDECTYYNKLNMGSSEKFGGVTGRCVSVVLTDYDITFGSVDKVKESFLEIMEEYKPKCVFLVTTCIIEIIGDDMDSLALELSDIYSTPVMSVHTEHFKSLDHLPGLERTMEACSNVMQKSNVVDCANFIGERLGDIRESELYSIVEQSGTEIGMVLPDKCSIDDIKKAANAKVNIVVHDIGLSLAKTMKEKFGTPYVFFNREVTPNRVYQKYCNLFKILEKDVPKEITEKYENTERLVKELETVTDGLTYIYSSTPMNNLEFNEFLCKLGMIPLLIQISKVDEQDLMYKDEILKVSDPYVSKSANTTPFQQACEELKPSLYFGIRDSVVLSRKGIACVSSHLAHSMLGFDVVEYMLEQITITLDSSQKNNEKMKVR